MSMIERLIPQEAIAKATAALATAEAQRRAKIAQALTSVYGRADKAVVDHLAAITSQAPSLRFAGTAAGGVLQQVMDTVANKLEGK